MLNFPEGKRKDVTMTCFGGEKNKGWLIESRAIEICVDDAFMGVLTRESCFRERDDKMKQGRNSMDSANWKKR